MSRYKFLLLLGLSHKSIQNYNQDGWETAFLVYFFLL